MEGDSGGNVEKIRGVNIHDDLVFDILSRLPVKSLLRFKCVCKSWLSIITQPQFIKAHLLRSAQSPRLLLNTKDSFVSMDFETPNHESKSLHCPWKFSDFYFSFKSWCSSDGLILLSADDRLFNGSKSCKSFVLWNPSNRSHKKISCPYELPRYSSDALCYDSTADDYRVIIVSEENDTTSVVIYSLRNNSWNIFIDNRYVLDLSDHQAVVNGAVHWVASPYESYSRVIVCFDLVAERFKEVPLPSSLKCKWMNLIVLGGHLGVYGYIGKRQMEIYAMKEYGKKESWSRLFIMPCEMVERSQSSTSVGPLLCLTKKGQVMISIGENRIGMYDPKYRTFLLHDSVRGLRAIPYVETLVLLDGGV